VLLIKCFRNCCVYPERGRFNERRDWATELPWGSQEVYLNWKLKKEVEAWYLKLKGF
jgi:hypothetical protein